MRVELTPRSAEIIAREQQERGAIPAEQLIEQALEILQHRTGEPSWFHESEEDARHRIAQSLEELRQGRSFSADEVLQEMDRLATGQ